MLSRNTTLTIITKFIMLLANFGLVVFTTQLWGSGGRGEIALVIANISIILIFSNIFCGSTVAYHAPVIERNLLLAISLSGAIIVSLAGGIIFAAVFGWENFLPLFLITLLLSLISAVSSYWLGIKNITNYNLLSLLSPIFILAALAIFYFILNKTTLNIIWLSYYTGLSVVLIIAVAGLTRNELFKVPETGFSGIKSILHYGVNNEFNYLIQFLNYRLSYYFIAGMLGLDKLGVFSIVVAVSEAVWIISRSMSAVHFSNVVNSDDHLKSRQETVAFARQSFLISLTALAVAVLIPRTGYQFIFGEEFGSVKLLIIYLMPGILAISVSNLYGHYFAGTGNLKVLRNKSLAGLAATLILLPLLIKKLQLTGACISLNVSYIISSFWLWYVFMKEGRSAEVKAPE
ncbi:MAG: polysaccharide biosynthesis C-terminal domain-containing protein [Bacteroidales bacterium]|nr:polysaccharide biosynthesis C-terminal domain-containing protein [Bacteroidales bacterium]